MAENQEPSKIKLFGTTIKLHGQWEVPMEDEPDKTNSHLHHHQEGQTLETRRRPDKIIPCPRCKSMDTKFCYFNNYNVNQPRHFCKGCQRYWTAGGVLRNVPVGAGRRKSKSATAAASQPELLLMAMAASNNLSGNNSCWYEYSSPQVQHRSSDVDGVLKE